MLHLALAIALQLPSSFAPSHLEVTSGAGTAKTISPGADVAFAVDPDPELLCDRRGDVWRCQGGWIEGRWVDELIAAVRDERPSGLAQSGYGSVLRAELLWTLRGAIREASFWTPAQKLAGLRLATPSGLDALIAADAIPTTTYAAGFVVRVRMTDRSNRALTIESRVTSRRKMLPWTVTFGGTRSALWRASISTAVARLLPLGDPNRTNLLAPQVNDWDAWYRAIYAITESCGDENDSSIERICSTYVR